MGPNLRYNPVQSLEQSITETQAINHKEELLRDTQRRPEWLFYKDCLPISGQG